MRQARVPSTPDENRSLLASDLSTPNDATHTRPYAEPASTVSTTRTHDALLLEEKEDDESVSVDEGDLPSLKEKNLNDGDPVTDWRAITWCAVVFFFIATITNGLNNAAYLYLNEKVDKTVSPVYSGLHIAATKTGHAAGVVLFAVYAYSQKCFKKPLLIGRAISFVAFGLYLAIKLFPLEWRRYVFLLAFFCQCFAEGSVVVINSYIPRASSRADRQAAYGIMTAAVMLSMLSGPLISLIATRLPAWTPLEWLEFNRYTYCTYAALIAGIVATVAICTQLKETESLGGTAEDSFSIKMATALTELRSMDKVALSFIFFERITASVVLSAMLAAFPPYLQTTLNMDHKATMSILSAGQGAAGIVSMAAVAAIIFTPLRRVRSSCVLFFALACYFIIYLYSYPWKWTGLSQPIVVMNDTTPNGCNVAQLDWCAHQWQVKTWWWIPPVVFLFGLAVPMGMISIDTTFSKMVGNIDQNLMQGAMELINDIASSIAPVITMKIFTDYGPATFWLVLAGVAMVGFLSWLPMIPKMRRLKICALTSMSSEVELGIDLDTPREGSVVDPPKHIESVFVVDDKESRAQEITVNDEELVTDWRAITWCAVVYFFITTIMHAMNVAAYSYLKEIDPTVTPDYSGYHVAAYMTGHAAGVVLFSVYAYSYKCFKRPLLIGRAISFLAFGLYFSLLIFPLHWRRYVFLASFFWQSLSEGSIVVFRSYIPRVNSKADRQAAFGVVAGAYMLGIIAGPVIQLLGTFLPSWTLFSWLEFNKYTYCIYFALIFGIVATVLICTKLTELPPQRETEEESFKVKLATANKELRSADKVGLSFVFAVRIITSVTFASFLAALLPYLQSTLNRDTAGNVLIASVGQAIVGTTSMAAVAALILSPLRRIRSSCILFFALGCYVTVYLYSYPWTWTGLSEPIAVLNEKSPHGCNSSEHEWCAHQWQVRTWWWIPPVTILLGLAVPTGMISIDTVFSKLLGNIDQNLMQGAMELTNDIASSIAPVITMKIFTDYGPATFWLVLAGVAMVGFLSWLPMIPKMRRLKM